MRPRRALRLAGLTLIPIILGDFIGLILNSHGRFFAAAAAPLVNALVSVLGLWFWSRLDLSALVWTLLLGAIAQGLVVVVALLRLRLGFPLATGAAKAEVRTTLMLGLPLLPAMMLANSAAAIVQFRAAQLGEGVVAAYGYAARLHGALAQVLVIGLSTVLLPHFAALWSRGETAEIVSLFRRLARCTILIVAYFTTGIVSDGRDCDKNPVSARRLRRCADPAGKLALDPAQPVAVPYRLRHLHCQILSGGARCQQHALERRRFVCGYLDRHLVRRIDR